MSSAAAEEPVPSVLPEEGIDLVAELDRYRDWIIQQALLRTGGNQSAAGRLLGYPSGGKAIWLYLRMRNQAKAKSRTRAKRSTPAPALAVAPPPAVPPPPPAPPRPKDPIEQLAARIDWAWVAQMRADGLSERIVLRRLAANLDAHWVLVEKALKLPRGLAKCAP